MTARKKKKKVETSTPSKEEKAALRKRGKKIQRTAKQVIDPRHTERTRRTVRAARAAVGEAKASGETPRIVHHVFSRVTTKKPNVAGTAVEDKLTRKFGTAHQKLQRAIDTKRMKAKRAAARKKKSAKSKRK